MIIECMPSKAEWPALLPACSSHGPAAGPEPSRGPQVQYVTVRYGNPDDDDDDDDGKKSNNNGAASTSTNDYSAPTGKAGASFSLYGNGPSVGGLYK